MDEIFNRLKKIHIFRVKSTLFKFVFEIEGLEKINSWVNEYFEVVFSF